MRRTARDIGDSQWLTVAETAALLRVTPRTVRRMISRGQLTGHRLGTRLIRIDSREVNRCLPVMPNARSGRGRA